MTQIAQGAHAYIFQEPGQVYRVQADDVATVQVVYGAPSALITLTAQSQTFGPYDSPAKLKVSANTAACEYTLIRAHYAELTQQQLAGGAVGVLASNNAGGAIEPDGDVPSLGGGGSSVTVVNNLTTGGTTAALSAEMGKTLQASKLGANADAIADVLEAAATGAPADLARIQSSVSGGGTRMEFPEAFYAGKFQVLTAKAQSGAAGGRILIVGDSTSWGQYSAGGPSKSWPKRFADLLTKRGIPAGSTGYGAWQSGGTGGVVDTRITLGTGWYPSTYGLGAACFTAGASGLALTYTIDGLVNTGKIYYLQNSGLGTLTIAVNGTTVGTVSCAGAAVVGAYSFSFAEVLNPVITVTPSIGTVFVLYFEFWTTSSTPVLRVLNAAVSGSTSAQWADAGGWKSLSVITAIAPEHTFIMLGRNDAQASVSASARNTSITAIVNKCLETGSVTLMSPVPADTSLGKEALVAEYMAADRALCASLGASYIDHSKDFISYAIAQSRGLMSDQIHENGPGHALVALSVMRSTGF